MSASRWASCIVCSDERRPTGAAVVGGQPRVAMVFCDKDHRSPVFMCSPYERDCYATHLWATHPEEVRWIEAVARTEVETPEPPPDEPLERAERFNLPPEMYADAADNGVFNLDLPLEGDPGCVTCGGQGVTRRRERCECVGASA